MVQIFRFSKPIPVTHFIPQGHTSEASPSCVTNQQQSIQMLGTMRDSSFNLTCLPALPSTLVSAVVWGFSGVFIVFQCMWMCAFMCIYNTHTEDRREWCVSSSVNSQPMPLRKDLCLNLGFALPLPVTGSFLSFRAGVTSMDKWMTRFLPVCWKKESCPQDFKAHSLNHLVIPSAILLCFFETGSLTKSRAHWLDQGASECWGSAMSTSQTPHPKLGQTWKPPWPTDLNSGLPACMTGTLLTEPSPWPPECFFKNSFW